MNWPVKPLGDVISFIRGITFKPEDQVQPMTDGSVVVMRTKNVQVAGLDESDLIAVPASFMKRNEQELDEGDILVSSANSWGLVGKASYVGPLKYTATAGGFISIVRAKKSVIDSRFLYHWITSPSSQHKIRHCGRQTTNISNLDVDRFKSLEVPVPPLPEQKRIATILDKADAIRRKRQKAIQLTDEFLRAVFLDMFGDPVTNPKEWKVKLLGQLIKEGPSNGLYKPSSEYGAGTRILRIDGFYSGVLAPQEKLKRVKLEPKEVAKYQLKDRSIVINRVNSREYLGKSAFVQELDEITVFESNMMNFSVFENLVNPYFLVQQFQTPFIKNQILKSAKDAVNQSSINQQDVKSLEVLVPELSLQRKFEQVCRHYNELLVKYDHSLTEFDNIFGSLSKKAFKGEL